MFELNETHESLHRSWIETANDPNGDFPLQNLPLGVISRDGDRHCCTIIGDQVFDLHVAANYNLLPHTDDVFVSGLRSGCLNAVLGWQPADQSALRRSLFDLLCTSGASSAGARDLADRLLVPLAEAVPVLPVDVGNFSDYLCSYDHAFRMGGGKVPPPFHYLPIAYNGRATSLCVSESDIIRPNGQARLADGTVQFGPEPSLDFELELGAFVGIGNALGAPLGVATAASRLVGYTLLNDWSARGIQVFESAPLGPFLGKSFATTISPWIVTPEALAPFRVEPMSRTADAPKTPAHLWDETDQRQGAFDICLTALVRTPEMQRCDEAATPVTTTNARYLYWTFAQMAAHHASNGCNLRTGDLLGSGTISGAAPESRACLAELTDRGRTPLTLPNGETRTWLHDGDEITFRARTSRAGFASIGFGPCVGRIVPAPRWPTSSAI